VRRVTVEKPVAEVTERYDLAQYFRCELSLNDSAHTAIVFARQVPAAWQIDSPIDEPVTAIAVFLKAGEEDSQGRSTLYFVADRIAWHPNILLGKLGMDYGLFDTVEQVRPITNEDRECFFQLLAAAGRFIPPQETGNVQSGDLRGFAGLMKAPADHLGELYQFDGTARRAIKIRITDSDVIARFGFDHYYELEVFIDLGGVLQIADRKVDTYPVVFCIRELPPGMPSGEHISEHVQVRGFMFKLWTYSTEITNKLNPELRMRSPLLVGRTIEWQSRQAQSGPTVGTTSVIVLSILVAAGLFCAWKFRRGDREFRSAVFDRKLDPKMGQSLRDLDSGARGESGALQSESSQEE
jgi:hypothetical protein